jgi:glycosyltransferase involved in cell wall biosynthesis
VSVVGIYRVKNEARWIKESIERTLQITDKVVLLDDHSTDATRSIAAAIPKVMVIPSPFQGLDEARDKDYLLGLALASKPDWIVQLDGDEVLTKKAIAELEPWVSQKKLGGILHFRIAYLWDDVNRERVDAVYRNFYQPRAYSLFDQTLNAYTFLRTGFGGNFHCGQVPVGHTGQIHTMKHPIKHYGYMDAADRERKYKWYNEKDPNNDAEGFYLHVIGKPNVHAPGPLQFFPFNDA